MKNKTTIFFLFICNVDVSQYVIGYSPLKVKYLKLLMEEQAGEKIGIRVCYG